MARMQSPGDLTEDLPYEVLSNELLTLAVFADNLTKVTVFTEFHDDVDFRVLFINDAIMVTHNIWVIEFPQDVDF